ncbi:MAG: addiction module protein [Bifidobacteriaceae bacterium]|jgi:hypothetical protein|nr:addiction module protein [Bifidobacteriaceae bacterium]
MVSETLWREVEALPVEDKLELVVRVEESLPYPPVPDSVLPRMTDEQLRQVIDEREAAMLADPSRGRDVDQEFEAIRSKLR